MAAGGLGEMVASLAEPSMEELSDGMRTDWESRRMSVEARQEGGLVRG